MEGHELEVRGQEMCKARITAKTPGEIGEKNMRRKTTSTTDGDNLEYATMTPAKQQDKWDSIIRGRLNVKNETRRHQSKITERVAGWGGVMNKQVHYLEETRGGMHKNQQVRGRKDLRFAAESGACLRYLKPWVLVKQ